MLKEGLSIDTAFNLPQFSSDYTFNPTYILMSTNSFNPSHNCYCLILFIPTFCYQLFHIYSYYLNQLLEILPTWWCRLTLSPTAPCAPLYLTALRLIFPNKNRADLPEGRELRATAIAALSLISQI